MQAEVRTTNGEFTWDSTTRSFQQRSEAFFILMRRLFITFIAYSFPVFRLRQPKRGTTMYR